MECHKLVDIMLTTNGNAAFIEWHWLEVALSGRWNTSPACEALGLVPSTCLLSSWEDGKRSV